MNSHGNKRFSTGNIVNGIGIGCMVTDSSYTCDEHSITQRLVELCSTPKTNVTLCVNYTSIKNINLKREKIKNRVIDTENRLVVAKRRAWGMGGIGIMGEGDQKLQTSNNKISKSWDVIHNIVTKVNNTVLYIWKLLTK